MKKKAVSESTVQEPKVEVSLPQINFGTIKVPIGGKVLVMDKFPEEARKGIIEKESGLSHSGKKKNRDFKQEVINAIHTTSDGRVGYPVYGFKKGMIESTSFLGDKFFSKKLVSSLQIINVVDGLIPINFKKQEVLEHSIGHITKFSPMFTDWSCELIIKYDKNNISPQDICTLLSYAGFYVGIGAWRPKCRDGGSGVYGMYEVISNVKK